MYTQTRKHTCTHTQTHTHIQTHTPSSAGVGPVKHFMNSSDAIFTKRHHITPRHDSIVHARVTCQALQRFQIHNKYNLVNSHKFKLFSNTVTVYLSKQCLSSARRSVHQNITIRSTILFSVPRGNSQRLYPLS